MNTYKIAVVPGDGIGPEVTSSAIEVLKAVAAKCGFEMTFEEYKVGGSAIDEYGHPLPEAALEGCRASDAVLLGAVGGPKWDSVEPALRPERALLAGKTRFTADPAGICLAFHRRSDGDLPQFSGFCRRHGRRRTSL